MAIKKGSSEIVDDEADINRRFEALETNASETKGLVEKMAAKLLGEEPPKPEKKGDPKPTPKTKSVKGFFQELGLLKPDSEA